MPEPRLTRRILLGAAAGSATALPFLTARATPVATPSASSVTPRPIPPEAAATYVFDVTLDTETSTIAGTASIGWRNTTGHDQNTLYLRLYPNATYYGDAETTLSQVMVDGRASSATSGASDPTVASISLGRTVSPEDTVRIDLAFTTRVPLGSAGSFGIFGVDMDRGSWALADWYPILAGWEPERDAWYLDAPTPFGDPTFPETATYALSLAAPEGFALIGTGDVISTRADRIGSLPATVHRIETGPVREFAMALLPMTTATDGALRRYPAPNSAATPSTAPVATPIPTTPDPAVLVSLYADEDIPGLAEAILDAAKTALPHYRALLGPLPEDAIEIASSHLAGANGVSWPGMVWLDLTILARDGELGEEERPGLRFTVVHEIGHQWIGGMLGLNSNDHGFMLEGLTNALAIGVIREAWGGDAAIEAMGRFVAGPYSGLVRDGRDELADQPLTPDTNTVLRALAVYGKAGLGFEAIRQALGTDAWRAAMSGFAARFRFGVFTPDDLRTALMAAASDPNTIDALWTFWFEETRTMLPDIDPVVQGAGA
ncbi:MAG: M1 family aminopeptidase [Thermomicrobiales bacterium]